MTSTIAEEIRASSTPVNIVDLQSFMGFANCYHQFIKGFTKIVKLLTDLTKKDIKWAWTPSCQDAFDTLKEIFTSGTILTHFDHNCPTKVETNTSAFGLMAVLSHLCEDEKGYSVAFHSRKFSPAEINYNIHYKEMAAIVAAFKEWAYMYDHRILVYTDRRTRECFDVTKRLN